MAEIDIKLIKSFLERLGKEYNQDAKILLLGGGALCLLGSSRPTLDIDYVGDDLKKDTLQNLIDEVAGKMGFSVEAVPIQEFTPLAFGEESRKILVGIFGKIEVFIIDPYVIALSKIERGFDTDIEDIVFLIQNSYIKLNELEKIVIDALPKAKQFDMNPSEIQEHLTVLRNALK